MAGIVPCLFDELGLQAQSTVTLGVGVVGAGWGAVLAIDRAELSIASREDEMCDDGLDECGYEGKQEAKIECRVLAVSTHSGAQRRPRPENDSSVRWKDTYS